jgi:hypothetical protein
MNETLQELFIKSKGNPIAVENTIVIQAGRLPINAAIISIRFLSPPDPDQGVSLHAKDGAIKLSDGTTTERLHIWNTPGTPSAVKHQVNCPGGELVLWNVYRVRHHSGVATEDQWTGNAGMVLKKESPAMRTYACSDWRTPFDPSALEFEVHWQDAGQKPG